MIKEKAWVWFKGGLKGGSWVAGFIATKSDKEGLLIEKSDFVRCRVPEWRVRFEEPEDLYKEPKIPQKALWKYI